MLVGFDIALQVANRLLGLGQQAFDVGWTWFLTGSDAGDQLAIAVLPLLRSLLLQANHLFEKRGNAHV